jgi:peptidoglycan/xylan/chitin deacetylase (PgdA/CDA1 family)
MSSHYSALKWGFAAINVCRADVWLGPLARGLGVIFTLHHVRPWQERAFAPNRLLEITPEFLDQVLHDIRAAGFDIISLDAAVERLKDKDTAHVRANRPFAVITFDDGYRDNVDYAAPILKKHNAPWTLFSCIACAQGQARLWWLELEEAIARLDRVRVDLPYGAIDLLSETAAQKSAVYDHIYWALRAGTEDALLDTIGKIAANANIDAQARVRELCMTFDELRSLAHDPNVTIGAHTVTHPRLAKLSEATAMSEMVTSKQRLETEIGQEIRHIAYPVGDPTSAGLREFALARQAGFISGVTTRPGHVFHAHAEHVHALPRVSLNGHFQTRGAVRAMLSGVPFALWNKGRRLNVS